MGEKADDEVPEVVSAEITRPIAARAAPGAPATAHVHSALQKARTLLAEVSATWGARVVLLGRSKYWVSRALADLSPKREPERARESSCQLDWVERWISMALSDLEQVIRDAERSSGVVLTGHIQHALSMALGLLDEVIARQGNEC